MCSDPPPVVTKHDKQIIVVVVVVVIIIIIIIIILGHSVFTSVHHTMCQKRTMMISIHNIICTYSIQRTKVSTSKWMKVVLAESID